jgi:hypothetical protein
MEPQCGCGHGTNLWKSRQGYRDGGAKGIRTPDLLNAIQTLYQLSYDPIRSGTRTVETQQLFVKNYLGKFRLVSMWLPPDP